MNEEKKVEKKVTADDVDDVMVELDSSALVVLMAIMIGILFLILGIKFPQLHLFTIGLGMGIVVLSVTVSYFRVRGKIKSLQEAPKAPEVTPQDPHLPFNDAGDKS